VNGGDEAEHVDTPRPMSHHKSVASASHDMTSSAAAAQAALSSRPISGRSRQLASTEVSSAQPG